MSLRLLIQRLKHSDRLLIWRLKHSTRLLIRRLKHAVRLLIRRLKHSDRLLIQQVKNSNRLLIRRLKHYDYRREKKSWVAAASSVFPPLWMSPYALKCQHIKIVIVLLMLFKQEYARLLYLLFPPPSINVVFTLSHGLTIFCTSHKFQESHKLEEDIIVFCCCFFLVFFHLYEQTVYEK